MAEPRPPVLDRAWLASRGLLPRVRRELLLDETLAGIPLDEAAQNDARAAADARWEESAEALTRAGLRREDLVLAEERARRLRRFQEDRWRAALPAYFLERKSALDQVVYWLLRTKNRLLARELYFRIKEGEEDFAAVATAHSEGSEADTCGLLGPTALGTLAPGLAKLLIETPPGTLRPPVQIGDWIVVVRLHRLLPCALDAAMETRLLDELLDRWVEEQLTARPTP